MPLTVCIVNDDEDDKELFCEVLAELNEANKCINISDSHEALRILRQSQTLPDFIFLDLNMSRASGVQLLKQLKGLHPYQ